MPYLWMFGTWAGGWHEQLTVHGPSGRTPEYGTQAMVDGMRKMLGWRAKKSPDQEPGQPHLILALQNSAAFAIVARR